MALLACHHRPAIAINELVYALLVTDHSELKTNNAFVARQSDPRSLCMMHDAPFMSLSIASFHHKVRLMSLRTLKSYLVLYVAIVKNHLINVATVKNSLTE